jgi:hypothetical protein
MQALSKNSLAEVATSHRRKQALATTIFTIACLALPGCGPKDTLRNEETADQTTPKPELALTPAQTEMEKLLQKRETDRKAAETATQIAKKAMARVLFDPVSVIYLDLRPGKNGSACGKVNAKNRMGAYVGYKDFVVDKDGNVEMSSYNDGIGSETYTTFAQAYLALCASAEERQAYEARTTVRSTTPEYDEPSYQTPDDVLDRPATDDSDEIPTA